MFRQECIKLGITHSSSPTDSLFVIAYRYNNNGDIESHPDSLKETQVLGHRFFYDGPKRNGHKLIWFLRHVANMRRINEKRKYYLIFYAEIPFADVFDENLARLQK